jgi:threonine 3-dehydrogenase
VRDVSVCLITGGAGNLACQLTWTLASKFERIVLFDVAPGPVGEVSKSAVFERGDLTDVTQLEQLFKRYQPRAVIHLASLLSGSCEQNRTLAWKVNMDGTFGLFETALRNGQPKILFASTVAAFGGQLPQILADDTPQWPDGLYGVTKMAIERLGVYYQRKHGLDFRCLRLPITISRHAPAGAASALASHAFIETVRTGHFTFLARPETKLAVIYISDVLRAFDDLQAAPASLLSRRVYNIGAMAVTCRQIADTIQRHAPAARLKFAPDEAVANLLASWPSVIDDRAARQDWNWKPEFDLERTADDFLAKLRTQSQAV